ncbi:MAG: prepilin-type N-terminal cleavage/methylation domain-containing protein [Actinobacteria bacterium]|nr:prepilin-type N-terminal cleavage/methylation domain-containing protein [Actinomycetota bacterium]
MSDQEHDHWRRPDQNGFTLIELLVVVAILGVLAAVVVVSTGGITNRGQDSACEIEARTVRGAQEARFAQRRSFTDDLDELRTDGYLSNVPTLVTATGSGGNTLQLQWAGRCVGVAGLGDP